MQNSKGRAADDTQTRTAIINKTIEVRIKAEHQVRQIFSEPPNAFCKMSEAPRNICWTHAPHLLGTQETPTNMHIEVWDGLEKTKQQ